MIELEIFSVQNLILTFLAIAAIFALIGVVRDPERLIPQLIRALTISVTFWVGLLGLCCMPFYKKFGKALLKTLKWSWVGVAEMGREAWRSFCWLCRKITRRDKKKLKPITRKELDRE